MSIHCNAKKEDIKSVVLMPGDPLRAKYIAENFLENARLVNTVRNMLAYTGSYKGKEITVFSSGMGMPSMGIYCYELYKFYDVDTIIRIGSCGSYNKDIKPLDTILVENSYTESNFAFSWNGKDCHIAYPCEETNKTIEAVAKENNLPFVKGSTLCGDCFDRYLEDLNSLINRFPKDLNIIGAEMEAFSLFYLAKCLNKKAACLLTVVDSLYSTEELSSKERETSLNTMIKIALESAVKIEENKL